MTNSSYDNLGSGIGFLAASALAKVASACWGWEEGMMGAIKDVTLVIGNQEWRQQLFADLTLSI